MRKQLALFVAIAARFTFSGHAMPAASLKGVSADQVTQVSGGCGPHRYRDHRGHCRHD